MAPLQKSFFFTLPVSDREKWVYNLIRPLIYNILITTFLLAVYSIIIKDKVTLQITSLIFSGTLVSIWLMKKSRLTAASYFIITVLLIGGIYGTTVTNGIHDTSMLILPGIIIVAGVLFESKAFFIFSLAALILVSALGISQVYGLTGKSFPGETTFLEVMVSVSILSGIILAVRILNNYLVNTLSTLFQRERELEQRAEELQASESRWRSLVYNAPEYIFHLEKDGTILFSNQIYPVNQEEDEHEIHKVYDYVPEEYHQVMKDTLNRVFLHGKKTSCEVRFLSPDGTYRWLSSHAAPITEKGKITSAIVIGNDITEMLELQEQLLQAQKMESIGQLAGGIAHDFNNLLTVINGHAQLAEVNLKNGLPVNEDIQAIQEAGYKAANLTRQILAFSRKEMIQPEKIDLKETLENFINMKSMLIGEDIEFSVKLSPDLSDILADRNQFEQMIINLLVNARDAIYEYKEAAEKKQIRIESKNQYFDDSYRKDGLVQQSGRHVVISISDTGKGMDANTKRHIFDPFFTTKGPGKGTGLGLAMVYGMVKQNGGRIHVYSEPGQGTTFKIIWPVAEGEEKAPKKKISQTATRGTEKILIVEDDEAVRNFTWATLKTLGYTIFAKANAFDALDFFREHKEEVDLLITDVIMPGMNGKEMVDKMLEIKSDLKVLFTSGYTDDYIHSSGIINEGINFINKPYSTTDMAIKVRTILDN